MSDSYQAIYDAVRSRIGVADVDAAIREAVSQSFSMADHMICCVADEFSRAAHEMQCPSAIYRPAISRDGDQWCALYGDDLQSGVCGFGDSPAAAMADFDAEWVKRIAQKGADTEGE